MPLSSSSCRLSPDALPPATEIAASRLRPLPWRWVAILLLAVILQAIFCVQLNRLYYSHSGPFYDSVAYQNHMVRMMADSREEGSLPVIAKELKTTTVVWPVLVAGMLGPWIEPSRAIGIWLQSLWIGALAFSAFTYAYRYRQASPAIALALSLLLISFAAVYQVNGGLSDFRMDLTLALLTGAACLWYLATYETASLRPWLAMGLFAGLACLGRATAPVYLIVMLGPLLAIRLFRSADRLRLFGRLSLAVAVTTVIAGWYYIYNYEYLRYYYVDWNTDANLNLALSQSRRHLHYAARNMGWLAAAAALLLGAHASPLWRRVSLVPETGGRLKKALAIDWRILWMGLAPALFLALRGSGPNKYVAMPSAVGLLLFLAVPLRGPLTVDPSRWPRLQRIVYPLAPAVCLLACAVAAVVGFVKHSYSGSDNPMAAYEAIWGGIEADAKRVGARHVRIGVPSFSYLNHGTLTNVLMMDRRYRYDARTATIGGPAMTVDAHAGANLAPATQLEFDQFAGGTDDEKIDSIAGAIRSEVDYVAFPEDAALDVLEQNDFAPYINTKARTIRDRVLARAGWTAITEPIAMTPTQRFVVYRNDARMARRPLTLQR